MSNVYEGLNARSEVHLSKEYFCKMYPTCVAFKLCESILSCNWSTIPLTPGWFGLTHACISAGWLNAHLQFRSCWFDAAHIHSPPPSPTSHPSVCAAGNIKCPSPCFLRFLNPGGQNADCVCVLRLVVGGRAFYVIRAHNAIGIHA